MDIKGKTIAITGSTGGIGIPLCKELLKRGANLILVDRNKAKSLALIEDLLKESGLELLHVYDAFTRELPAEDSQRIYFVCRRPAR